LGRKREREGGEEGKKRIVQKGGKKGNLNPMKQFLLVSKMANSFPTFQRKDKDVRSEEGGGRGREGRGERGKNRIVQKGKKEAKQIEMEKAVINRKHRKKRRKEKKGKNRTRKE
jgi:hypothetical protein